MIYELRKREDRFEQSSQAQNERGLGAERVTIRNTSLNPSNSKRERYEIAMGLNVRDSQNSRFALPGSVRNDFTDSVIKTSELNDFRK